MSDSKRKFSRRSFLKGVSAAGVLGAAAVKLGLPIGPVISEPRISDWFDLHTGAGRLSAVDLGANTWGV